MCLLCINNLKCFPSEFKIYAKDEYEKHVRFGDKCGSQGHPNCEFCRTRYFDKHGLFMHLHKDHFTCHICEKMGIMFRYYEDYTSLENHFRREHCLCEDSLCLDRKFVVFASEVELAQHQRQWHPDLKVRIAFRRNSFYFYIELNCFFLDPCMLVCDSRRFQGIYRLNSNHIESERLNLSRKRPLPLPRRHRVAAGEEGLTATMSMR
jgi:hypothetical protein